VIEVDSAMEALGRLGQGKRSVEDAMSFSLGHRLRIEIRAALHEGPATSAQLAEIVGQPRETITYQLQEMLKDGSIDVAKTEKVGNMDRHYYCVVELPHFSDEEIAAMSPGERQTLFALVVQAASTEALASLLAGRMAADPRVFIAWNRINLDSLGAENLADEAARSWCRRHEIEAESVNRRAETGEPGVTYVITSFAYQRSRTTAPEPLWISDNSHEVGVEDRFAVLQRWKKAGNIEDAVSYSLGHRLRVEIRAALHEGPATASQLAEIIQEPLNVVHYHLKEMLGEGSIDIVKAVRVGNITQRYYAVTKLPRFSDEEFAAMDRADRQILCAIAVQAATAEAMASLWAGKMVADPRVFLAWNRINLDKQGRDDLADEEATSWGRKEEIEAESANRRAKTGESGTSYVITSMGYARSRSSAPDPLDVSHLATKKT
jgi:predicted ArsR family transcriptional regulator